MIERIKNYFEEITLGFILLVAAVLRFHHLGFTSLSNDELSAITRAKYDSFSAMIQHGVMIDFHPAGVEAFMYYWLKLFGDDVFIVRFPFAVAGVLAVFVLYLLAKTWFSKTTGLFASAALSVLQFPLMYSQLARPYAFGLLFILLASYFWTKILFPEKDMSLNSKSKWWVYAGFIISMSACTHTHYFAFMLAGIIGLSGCFFLTRSTIKGYLLSGLIIILLFLPEIPVFTAQMSIGGLGWLSKPDQHFFMSFIKSCFNDSDFVLYMFTGMFLASLLVFRKSLAITKFHWLSLLWFLLPYFIGYYYSLLRSPVLQYSTLLFGFPFLLMFIFSFFPEIVFRKSVVIVAVILFTVAGASHTVKVNYYYWTNHFGVFKEIAADALKWSDTYGEDKIAKVITVINPKYIDYYFDKMGHQPKIDLYNMEDEQDLARLMALTDTSSRTYLLYGWSNIWHPGEALQIIMKKFPTVVERDTFFNSQITLFKRGEAVPSKGALSFSSGYESDAWGKETNVHTDEQAHTGMFSEKMDAQKEFSITCTKPLAEFNLLENGMVTATVWFRASDPRLNAKLVLDFSSPGKSLAWVAADLKSFNLKAGEWQHAIISYPLPKAEGARDVMKVYVWNPGKNTFYVDDFEIKVERQNIQ